MKFEEIKKNSFIIKLNNSYKKINKDNQNLILKNILILLKKRYAYNINGYYEVDIYNSKHISLIYFNKIDDNDRLYNNIDLKIINHNIDINLYIEDYEIIKNNYINCDLIDDNEMYKICEHYTVVKPNLHS